VARIGVVLGAGGCVGMAFHGGVLAGLEEATGWDPRTAEIVIGTSAGSMTAALLRQGLSGADLRALSEEQPLSAEGALLAAVGRPHRPRVRVASFIGLRPLAEPAALVRALRRPWQANLRTLWPALLPEGPVPTDAISDGLDDLADGRWPQSRLWVSAVRLGDGRRVVFGRPGAPPASLGEAVAASCAIPAFFRPVTIGDQRYVDGGVASAHHLDLLAGEPLDAVVVSAPMSHAGQPALSVDMALRLSVRMQLDREIAALRRRGIPVLAIAPSRRVCLAMGLDSMDARRRGVVSRQARLETLELIRGGGPASELADLLADAATERPAVTSRLPVAALERPETGPRTFAA
jgi:NTE family protein